MTLKSDAKFEKKLTCGLEIDMKELGKFSSEHSSLKIGTLMTLKLTEELCVKTVKNDGKFEEELTCRFKIDMDEF